MQQSCDMFFQPSVKAIRHHTVLPAAVLRCLQVMIGASEVGSVVPLVKEGQTVKKVSCLPSQPDLLLCCLLLCCAACR
jgi:hypothetical protein